MSKTAKQKKSPTLRRASSMNPPIVADALRAKADAVAAADADSVFALREVADVECVGCPERAAMSSNGLKPWMLRRKLRIPRRFSTHKYKSKTEINLEMKVINDINAWKSIHASKSPPSSQQGTPSGTPSCTRLGLGACWASNASSPGLHGGPRRGQRRTRRLRWCLRGRAAPQLRGALREPPEATAESADLTRLPSKNK